MDPSRFAFGLMTRSKAITRQSPLARAEFVDEIDRVSAREARSQASTSMLQSTAPMFSHFVCAA